MHDNRTAKCTLPSTWNDSTFLFVTLQSPTVHSDIKITTIVGCDIKSWNVHSKWILWPQVNIFTLLGFLALEQPFKIFSGKISLVKQFYWNPTCRITLFPRKSMTYVPIYTYMVDSPFSLIYWHNAISVHYDNFHSTTIDSLIQRD